MSTFVYRDEYNMMGGDFDAKFGFTEMEGYEPLYARFIVAYNDGTWKKNEVQLPLLLCHEKCTDSHLVHWFSQVWGDDQRDVAYVGVLEKGY